MKSIPIERSGLKPADLVKLAQIEPVVLTKKGQPVCAVVEIDDLDVEAWSLGNNPQFLAILEESRQQLRARGGTPLAEVRRRLLGNGKRRSKRTAKK